MQRTISIDIIENIIILNSNSIEDIIMMFQIGRYARITKLGLKYSGKDGFIKSFDNMYVILKMVENSQCIRVLRKNVTVHNTALLRKNITVHHTALMIRSSDGELGTLVNSNFTPTVTERTQHILFYTNAGGSACNKTFDSMDKLKEFVIDSRGFTQMRYRTETVRTTPLKEIKIKTSYEF